MLWVTVQGEVMKYHATELDVSRLFRQAEFKAQDCVHIFRGFLATDMVRRGVPRPIIRYHFGWSTNAMIGHCTSFIENPREAMDYLISIGFRPFGGQ